MKAFYKELDFSLQVYSDLLFLKNGNIWLFLGSRKSRYFGGYFFYQNRAIRFLDEILFCHEIKGYQILDHKRAILEFPHNKALLEIKNSAIEIIFENWDYLCLNFDVKDIFDNEPFKRKIEINSEQKNTFFVRQYLPDFNAILRIESDAPLKINNIWQKKNLDFDKDRNSPPFEWWTYNGLEGKVRELKIFIEKPGLTNDSSKKTIINYGAPLPSFIINRLNALFLHHYLPAGFPWFFENWYRDELLTFYLLSNQIDKDFQNERLLTYLHNLDAIWDQNKSSQSILASDTLLLLIANLDQNLLEKHFHLIENFLNRWQAHFVKEGKI
ncbi:MAG: hypothetical protein NZ822_01355, partial [Patescibacteria group bacterium]|nr:hypothetical protein [Patescibacteria group bacterium]